MAINFASMMLNPSPIVQLDFGRSVGGGDRERLKLLREQFAETKKQNELDNEYRRTHEAAENARAQLAAQVERDKAAATAAQKLADDKRKAHEAFVKYRESGDIEGMEALVPFMTNLGMNVERRGEDENGLPSYQVDMDRAAVDQAESARAAQAAPYGENESAVQSLDRLGALGYPSLSERGNLDEPALDAPITTEDAFGRGLKATEHFAETGQAMRGPDQADIMGSVPKNVIDIGAEQQQVMRRLKPSLDAYRDSYPEAYRGSVDKSNEAAAAMALPGPKALETAQKMRGDVDKAVASELVHDRKAEEGVKPLTRIEEERLSNGGYKKALGVANEVGLGDIRKSQKAASMVLELLGNQTAWDDPMIGFQLTRLLGSIGPQSNRDIDIALGGDGMGAVDKVTERIVAFLKGGYSDERREQLMNIVQTSTELDDDKVYDLLDTIDRAAAAEKDPEVRRGWLTFKKTIPQEYLDAHEEAKGEDGSADPEDLDTDTDEEQPAFDDPGLERQGSTEVQRVGSRAGQPRPASARIDDDDEFMDELLIQTEESGLDPNAILAIIGGESGGKADAASDKSSAKGLIQFLNSTARRYGFGSSKDFAKLSRTEQVPYIVQYLKDSGINEDSMPEDYGVAVAAPAFVGKPDDTVVYQEGTKEHAKNAPWWPEDGGDITVGDIKAYYRSHRVGGGVDEPEPADAMDEDERAEAEEGGDLDAEVLDILR